MGEITDLDSVWQEENLIPVEVARGLDRTERDQLISMLRKCMKNGGYDDQNEDILSPVGSSAAEDGQIVVGKGSKDNCFDGTYLEKIQIDQWIKHIPEYKREAAYDLLHLGTNAEGLTPVEPVLIPPLLVKAAGLKIAHQLVDSVSKKGNIAELKKDHKDGNWIDTLIGCLGDIIPKEEFSAVCERMELVKKYCSSSITGSNPGVLPTMIADVLSTGEERHLIRQLLSHWAKEQIKLLRFGKVNLPKPGEKMETGCEEENQGNKKEDEVMPPHFGEEKSSYLLELPKKNIFFLTSSFSQEKQDLIHITVLNLRNGAKNYSTLLKNNADLVTNELIENISPHVMISICQTNQGTLRTASNQYKYEYKIEEDIEYIEKHEHIIPKKVCKFLSPSARRTITGFSQLRQKMRKEKFDEKLYVLNCQWLPREVAELLTREETKCLVRNLKEHKNMGSNLSINLSQSKFEENKKIMKRINKESNPRSNSNGMKAENSKEGNKNLNMRTNYVKNAEEGSKKLTTTNDGDGKNPEEDKQENEVSIPTNHKNGEKSEEGNKQLSLKSDANGMDTEEDKECNKELAMRIDGEGGKNAEKDKQVTEVSIPKNDENGMNADGDKEENKEANLGNNAEGTASQDEAKA